jgi:hypothetical protein
MGVNGPRDPFRVLLRGRRPIASVENFVNFDSRAIRARLTLPVPSVRAYRTRPNVRREMGSRS